MAMFDLRVHDGSRHFLVLPESCSWAALTRHLCRLPGLTITDEISDGVLEIWIDFRLEGQDFTINNQMGEYWFFAEDAACDEALLRRIEAHIVAFLGNRA